MGQQDDLCTGVPGGAQGLHHITGRAGVGDEEDDIIRGHQAGGEQLEMAVTGGAELGGQAGKPGADVIRQQHTAALTKTEDLLRVLHQFHSFFDSVGRERVLGAVDGVHEERGGVFTERAGCGTGFGFPWVEWGTGGVSLRKGNAHFVVAIEAQRTAEPKNSGLGDFALLGEGGDREILGFVGVLHQIFGNSSPGFCQGVLSFVQQFPKIRRHNELQLLLMRFPKRKASGTDFLTPSYKKSIKEIFLLDKWGFEHKFGAVSVQSVQKITIIVVLLAEKTFQTDKNDGKTIFKAAK